MILCILTTTPLLSTLLNHPPKQQHPQQRRPHRKHPKKMIPVLPPQHGVLQPQFIRRGRKIHPKHTGKQLRGDDTRRDNGQNVQHVVHPSVVVMNKTFVQFNGHFRTTFNFKQNLRQSILNGIKKRQIIVEIATFHQGTHDTLHRQQLMFQLFQFTFDSQNVFHVFLFKFRLLHLQDGLVKFQFNGVRPWNRLVILHDRV